MIIAVASGKGGTGKTFVSTNLFQLLVNKGLVVNLVDCDAEVPNTNLFFNAEALNRWSVEEYRPSIIVENCTFCGKCSEYCEYNAIFYVPAAGKIKVLGDICHGCAACQEACQSGAINPSSKIVGELTSFSYGERECIFEGRMGVKNTSSVPIIKEAIEHSLQNKSQLTILDAPPGTSCPFIQTAVRSDLVILVTEPTPFGISDLHQAISTLKELGVPYKVVVNRADIGEKIKTIPAEDIIAEIPFSADIAKVYAKGGIAVKELEAAKAYFEPIVEFLINKIGE